MGKLDKKVLKVITSQKDMDYDVDDISIALKCDDYDVQEALDSLKDQGLIEAVIHNGKKFWKPAKTVDFSNEDYQDIAPQPRRDEPVDILILEQPARSFRPQEQQNKFQRTFEQPQRFFNPIEKAARQQQRAQEQFFKPPTPTRMPVQRYYENEIVDQPTRSFTQPPQPAKSKPAPIEDDFDDDEFDKPRRGGSSIGTIFIAILLSAGVAAFLALSLTNKAAKGFDGSIAAMEGKVKEASAMANQRIDALSLKMDNLKTDIAAQAAAAATVQEPQVKAPPTKTVSKQARRYHSRSMATKKAAVRAKHAAAWSKKRKSPLEMIRKTSASVRERPSFPAAPEAMYSSSIDPASEASTTESPPSPPSESGSSPHASDQGSGANPWEESGETNSPAPTDGGGQ